MGKFKVKHFIIFAVIIIAIIIIAIFLYFKFYGKNIFEAKLSEILGRPIRFAKFTLDLEKYTVRFEDFRVPNRRGFKGKDLFNAAKVIVILDKERFNKDKEIAFDHITIERGTLHAERNRGGAINLAGVRCGSGMTSAAAADVMAYAQEPPTAPLYTFAKSVKALTIKDSSIELKDYGIFGVPFGITFDSFNADVRRGEGERAGFIPIECTASFTIPSGQYRDGQVILKTHIDTYQYIADIAMALKTQNIDLMQFYPYLEEYTPFSVRQGVFSSETTFDLENNMIDSLTTMVFHGLRLGIDPGKENAEFLRTSVTKLAPYLTSRSGGLVFDFTIRGPRDNPQMGVGPQVRKAVGMAAMQEFGNVLQGLQGLQE